jgi:hypothetical protein
MPAFVIRIFKAFGGRTSSQQWSNTYHWTADGTVEAEYWQQVVEALAQLEQSIHAPQVNFMRGVVSTHEQEPEYNPLQLRVFEMSAVGNRTPPAGEKLLDLNLALKVKKVVRFGRAGTAFYRGVLHTGDVEVGAGGNAVLVAGAVEALNTPMHMAFVNAVTQAETASGGQLIMNPGKLLDGGQAAAIRAIDGLRPSGVSVNRRDHRYFDTKESDDGVGVGT